jgi:hypothetical protein
MALRRLPMRAQCHLLTHAAQQSVEWEVRDNPQQYERVTRHRRAGQLLCRLGRKLPVPVGLSDYILAQFDAQIVKVACDAS